MIIPRSAEMEILNGIKKWLLVYGRRKTGKSFLIENFIQYDDYFFVKRDRTILSKKSSKTMSYETFIELVKMQLEDGKTIVIDEFHRLGDDFFDFVHYTKKSGKMILVSSTLFLSKKLLSVHSPLVGFFAEIPIGLIDLKDCITSLKKLYPDKKQLTEMAVIVREPITIPYLNENIPTRKAFAEMLAASAKTVPTLVGEVFVEEDRTMSAVYEGLLRAIANGKAVSTEMSSYLFSRGLIKKDDSSMIQQYLNNLVEFGLIKKLQVHNRNKFIYRILSPLCWAFYYADEKYNISEKQLNVLELERIVEQLMPHIMEDQLREFIASEKGLTETVVQTTDSEIDGLLLRFKKPEIAMEVKWKEKIDKKDIADAEKNLEKVTAKEKWLVVPDKKKVKQKTKLKVVDIFDLI